MDGCPLHVTIIYIMPAIEGYIENCHPENSNVDRGSRLYCRLYLLYYYGPAPAGPLYEISFKILHDLLRGSMGIQQLYSDEERLALFYIRIYYLFVCIIHFL
jgi:hypothetical protein